MSRFTLYCRTIVRGVRRSTPQKKARRIVAGAVFGVLATFTLIRPAVAQDSTQSAAANTGLGTVPWSSARLQLGYTPPPGFAMTDATADTDVTFQGSSANGARSTIVIEALPSEGATMEFLANVSTQMLRRTTSPDLKVTGRAETREGGNDVYRIDSVGTAEAAVGGTLHLKIRQIFVTHERRTFGFCLVTDASVFVEAATAFERSLASVLWSIPIPEEHVTLTDIGMSAVIPENWRRLTAEDANRIPGVFQIVGPLVDGFRSNFTMVLDPKSPGLTALPATEAQNIVGKGLRQFDNFRLVAQNRVTIDGEPAIVLDGAFQYPQTRKPGRDRTVVLVHNERLYTFRLSTSQSGFDSSAQAAFASLMTSIRWVQPGAAAPLQ